MARIGIADAREGGFKVGTNGAMALATSLESLTLAKVVSKLIRQMMEARLFIGIADAREGGFKDQPQCRPANYGALESLTLAKVVSKLFPFLLP